MYHRLDSTQRAQPCHLPARIVLPVGNVLDRPDVEIKQGGGWNSDANVDVAAPKPETGALLVAQGVASRGAGTSHGGHAALRGPTRRWRLNTEAEGQR